MSNCIKTGQKDAQQTQISKSGSKEKFETCKKKTKY